MIEPEHWLKPAIHPVYARLLCAELRRRGFGEAEIIAGTHLDWETLHTDNRFLSLEQMRRLTLHALALSQCPWLGIEVGNLTQLSAHGALGSAVVASNNLVQALAVVERYASLRQGVASMRQEQGENLCMVIDEHMMPEELREYLLGHFVASLLRLLETVTGKSLQGEVHIEWPFAEPPWAAMYQHLAVQNSFGNTQLRIHVTANLINSPSLAADPEAARIALRECERLLQKEQQGGSLTQRVQSRLVHCKESYPTLEEMAEEEHVSSRTLIRHLHEEGTTYQQLLDDVRKELACWLLLQTELPVEMVAERLGYGDTSNFSRTFRRWLGVTPREFRTAS